MGLSNISPQAFGGVPLKAPAEERQIMKHQHREQAAESQHLLGKELRPHKTTRPQWTSRVIYAADL